MALKLKEDQLSKLTKAYQVLVAKVEEQFDTGVRSAIREIKARFTDLNLSVLDQASDQ